LISEESKDIQSFTIFASNSSEEEMKEYNTTQRRNIKEMEESIPILQPVNYAKAGSLAMMVVPVLCIKY
jgi:hypothetical protein